MKKNGNFKKIIAFGIVIIILIALIVAAQKSGISLKREIIIIGKNANISTVNLGKIGSLPPFQIKNKDRVNFLFLGIPGEGNPAPNLTDTILIINSTPKAENPVGISVPRDLLVKHPSANWQTKINALYQDGGIETIKNAIAAITGLEIDYYLVLSLEGVKKIIDKLGGIDINIKEDIYDPKFPAAYNSYEIFSLKSGLQHLDGETALKYIRTRNQPQGDFSRIERQQQIISALKNKILSLNPIWNFPKILGLWRILEANSETNIGLTDIRYAWNLAKKANLDEINFNTIASPLITSDTATLGGQTASVLIPKLGLNNYSEIKNYINQLINNP